MSTALHGMELRLKSVLVATDFSETFEMPLRLGLAVAHHYGTAFYVAHVVSDLAHMIAGPPALQLACEAASRELQNLEHDLVEKGSLVGLDHEFVVRQGAVWKELENIILEKRVDLLILGTHGRRGLSKLVLGSVAEEIFRHAHCLVLTVGPNSYEDNPSDLSGAGHTFLFATDFGEASFHALPYAMCFANQFKAKLVLLNVIPAAPIPEGPGWYTASDVMAMRDNARMASLRRLEQLPTGEPEPIIEPEFMVQFGLPTEKILDAALKLKVELIIMGLHASTRISTISHMPWATAYEVVSGAGCPVLTIRI